MMSPERLLTTRLPPNWSVRATGGGRRLALRGPGGARAELTLEARRTFAPRDVLAIAAKLGDGNPSLVYAPFLSPRTRDLLRQSNISFLDATGNVRIALACPALFIEAGGADRDPNSKPSPSLRSLKGRAAGRVVRALCDFSPPYGIRELAERSRTALGSVARVVSFLYTETLLSRDESGRVLDVRWEELLERWARDYDMMRSNETSSWLAPRGLETISAKLRGSRGRWCLTGALAAARKAAAAPPRLALLYSDDPDSLARRLDLRRAESGANVVLARPFDDVVFDRTWEEDGLRFASLCQVVVDLRTSPSRSEADDLLRWMKAHETRWRA